MTTEADRINARLTDEARETARTRLDLDAFLSLKGEQRAARWRQWDRMTKMDAVIQMLGRLDQDWSEQIVAEWIAKYDAKYGAEPLPTERAVCAALERLADEQRRSAEQSGDSCFKRAATAYAHAVEYYRDGVRPDVLDDGRVQLRRAGGGDHIVTLRPGQMPICSCKAADSMHWPIALVIGLEVAQDHMQAFDDGDGEPTEEEPAAPNPIPHAAQAAAWLAGRQQLAQRLAATAAYLETLRAEQQRTTAPEPTPRQLGVRLMQARKKSAYFASAFYLEAA